MCNGWLEIVNCSSIVFLGFFLSFVSFLLALPNSVVLIPEQVWDGSVFHGSTPEGPRCLCCSSNIQKAAGEEMKGRRFFCSVAIVVLGRVLPGGLDMYHLKLKYYSSLYQRAASTQRLK